MIDGGVHFCRVNLLCCLKLDRTLLEDILLATIIDERLITDFIGPVDLEWAACLQYLNDAQVLGLSQCFKEHVAVYLGFKDVLCIHLLYALRQRDRACFEHVQSQINVL